MPEETPQLPLSEQEVQIQAPSFKDKLKLHRKKILVGVGLFFGILILTGVVFGAYLISRRQAQPISQLTPTPEVATPTPDPTADWETYTNTEYGYSIKYPLTMNAAKAESLVIVSNELYQEIISRLESEWWGGTSQSPNKAEDIVVAGTNAKKISGTQVTTGYGLIEAYFPKRELTFRITLSIGPEEVEFGYDEDTFNLILSTFKFLEKESQSIIIPDIWREYAAIDPDFGIKTTLSLPPGFSFSFTGSEFTIQNTDVTELWDYSTSVFRKGDTVENFYKGESRRAWYQDYLEGKFLEEKPVLFEEGKIDRVVEYPIGSQTYLELTVSGGVNYVGEVEKHFVFVQNQILHIIRPASFKANSAEAQIPGDIGIIFYSLKLDRID